jgi:hypothetical protein
VALKSSRPTYAIILLFVSGFFVCMTFLPFLYSVVFPNDDLQGFVAALEGRQPPSMESDAVVRQALAAVGILTRTIQIGYSYHTATKIHYAEPLTSNTIKTSQIINIAWFEKHPKPVLVAFTCYTNGDNQKAYRVSEVSPLIVMRGYAIPLCFFGFSLFIARKRKSLVAVQ